MWMSSFIVRWDIQIVDTFFGRAVWCSREPPDVSVTSVTPKHQIIEHLWEGQKAAEIIFVENKHNTATKCCVALSMKKQGKNLKLKHVVLDTFFGTAIQTIHVNTNVCSFCVHIMHKHASLWSKLQKESLSVMILQLQQEGETLDVSETSDWSRLPPWKFPTINDCASTSHADAAMQMTRVHKPQFWLRMKQKKFIDSSNIKQMPTSCIGRFFVHLHIVSSCVFQTINSWWQVIFECFVLFFFFFQFVPKQCQKCVWMIHWTSPSTSTFSFVFSFDSLAPWCFFNLSCVIVQSLLMHFFLKWAMTSASDDCSLSVIDRGQQQKNEILKKLCFLFLVSLATALAIQNKKWCCCCHQQQPFVLIFALGHLQENLSQNACFSARTPASKWWTITASCVCCWCHCSFCCHSCFCLGCHPNQCHIHHCQKSDFFILLQLLFLLHCCFCLWCHICCCCHVCCFCCGWIHHCHHCVHWFHCDICHCFHCICGVCLFFCCDTSKLCLTWTCFWVCEVNKCHVSWLWTPHQSSITMMRLQKLLMQLWTVSFHKCLRFSMDRSMLNWAQMAPSQWIHEVILAVPQTKFWTNLQMGNHFKGLKAVQTQCVSMDMVCSNCDSCDKPFACNSKPFKTVNTFKFCSKISGWHFHSDFFCQNWPKLVGLGTSHPPPCIKSFTSWCCSEWTNPLCSFCSVSRFILFLSFRTLESLKAHQWWHTLKHEFGQNICCLWAELILSSDFPQFPIDPLNFVHASLICAVWNCHTFTFCRSFQSLWHVLLVCLPLSCDLLHHCLHFPHCILHLCVGLCMCNSLSFQHCSRTHLCSKEKEISQFLCLSHSHSFQFCWSQSLDFSSDLKQFWHCFSCTMMSNQFCSDIFIFWKKNPEGSWDIFDFVAVVPFWIVSKSAHATKVWQVVQNTLLCVHKLHHFSLLFLKCFFFIEKITICQLKRKKNPFLCLFCGKTQEGSESQSVIGTNTWALHCHKTLTMARNTFVLDWPSWSMFCSNCITLPIHNCCRVSDMSCQLLCFTKDCSCKIMNCHFKQHFCHWLICCAFSGVTFKREMTNLLFHTVTNSMSFLHVNGTMGVWSTPTILCCTRIAFTQTFNWTEAQIDNPFSPSFLLPVEHSLWCEICCVMQLSSSMPLQAHATNDCDIDQIKTSMKWDDITKSTQSENMHDSTNKHNFQRNVQKEMSEVTAIPVLLATPWKNKHGTSKKVKANSMNVFASNDERENKKSSPVRVNIESKWSHWCSPVCHNGRLVEDKMISIIILHFKISVPTAFFWTFSWNSKNCTHVHQGRKTSIGQRLVCVKWWETHEKHAMWWCTWKTGFQRQPTISHWKQNVACDTQFHEKGVLCPTTVWLMNCWWMENRKHCMLMSHSTEKFCMCWTQCHKDPHINFCGHAQWCQHCINTHSHQQFCNDMHIVCFCHWFCFQKHKQNQATWNGHARRRRHCFEVVANSHNGSQNHTSENTKSACHRWQCAACFFEAVLEKGTWNDFCWVMDGWHLGGTEHSVAPHSLHNDFEVSRTSLSSTRDRHQEQIFLKQSPLHKNCAPLWHCVIWTMMSVCGLMKGPSWFLCSKVSQWKTDSTLPCKDLSFLWPISKTLVGTTLVSVSGFLRDSGVVSCIHGVQPWAMRLFFTACMLSSQFGKVKLVRSARTAEREVRAAVRSTSSRPTRKYQLDTRYVEYSTVVVAAQ